MRSPTSDPSAALLLGADVGATRARVRVRDRDGRLLAAAEGAGFNVNSTGDGALAGLRTTVQEVLVAAGIDPRRVPVRAALGIAGAGPAHHAQVEQLVRSALAGIGLLPQHVTVTDDQITAFAAGSAGGSGLLLLGGTGSAAVRYRDFVPCRRVDGMGWLLGDTGSGVWIGRRVLQAAAADLDARGPASALTAAVLSRLGIAPDGAEDPRQALIAAIHPLAPAAWGAFAPLTEGCATDPVAQEILAEASRELIAKVDAVRREEDGDLAGAEEIVLVGSVLTRNATVSAAVRAGLAERGLRVLEAAEPVEGALRLAARDD
ncbi:BadF/BadG/BcrA/BcrD ATPase family protein [Brachybacterium hainanense]|uniref:BadF/BadG/BcrA/BcrD ATPase family protein n=1 Tax=Brachybacterium hainanense TaxID=1541174 RepID=A0ABV6REY9_9MICO